MRCQHCHIFECHSVYRVHVRSHSSGMGSRASMDLEPYEVEKVDSDRQEAHQGKWAMGNILGKLAV